MTLLTPTTEPKAAMAEAEKALSLPIGVASPLWLMFAGAASAGVAYWWLARWRTMTNLEAQLAPPVAELPAAEQVTEAVAEPVLEAVAEADPEPVLEAAVESPAAPIEAVEVVEAVAEPVVEAALAAAAETGATIPKPKAAPKAKAASGRAAPRTTR